MAFFFSIIIKVFYFLKKGVSSDLHIIGRDSSSLAQGAGYLHIRIQKRGGDDSLKPSLLRIKSSVSLSLSLSLSLSVCTHRYSSNATIFFSPFFPRCIKSDMRYFSHMTPDRIHPSTSVGWTFLFHCFFRHASALHKRGVYSTDGINRNRFRNFVSFFNKSFRHADENWYINLLHQSTKVFLWLYIYIHAERLWRRFSKI